LQINAAVSGFCDGIWTGNANALGNAKAIFIVEKHITAADQPENFEF